MRLRAAMGEIWSIRRRSYGLQAPEPRHQCESAASAVLLDDDQRLPKRAGIRSFFRRRRSAVTRLGDVCGAARGAGRPDRQAPQSIVILRPDLHVTEIIKSRRQAISRRETTRPCSLVKSLNVDGIAELRIPRRRRVQYSPTTEQLNCIV